ncbi:hypothetical protein [Streptomyces maremycinicus]|uniref:hypothetical protein n=1 Tax=Streptomyces maremycinicus TaxID=1679753 RepID=UPI000AA8ADA2|nr:hypothetical protein [Streptomyces sp. NBRC 110468]
MPLSHDHVRTTVETYLALHPCEREQLGAFLDTLERPTDIARPRVLAAEHGC